MQWFFQQPTLVLLPAEIWISHTNTQNKTSSLEKRWPHAASELKKKGERRRWKVFWVARRGQGVPSDPSYKGTRETAAAERRLKQKLKSYHHPDDIGACLLPSDINPLVVLPTWIKQVGLTSELVWERKRFIHELFHCHYPFLHLKLWSVGVAFLPLQRHKWKSGDSSDRYASVRAARARRTCVAFSSCSFKSARSRSVSRNWAFNFSFSAKICS